MTTRPDHYPIAVCTADTDGIVPHWCWDAEAGCWDRFCIDSQWGVQQILFGSIYCLAPISRRPRKLRADQQEAQLTLYFRVRDHDREVGYLIAACEELTSHCAALRSAGGMILHTRYIAATTRRVDVLIRDVAAFQAAFVDTDAYHALVPASESEHD